MRNKTTKCIGTKQACECIHGREREGNWSAALLHLFDYIKDDNKFDTI